MIQLPLEACRSPLCTVVHNASSTAYCVCTPSRSFFFSCIISNYIGVLSKICPKFCFGVVITKLKFLCNLVFFNSTLNKIEKNSSVFCLNECTPNNFVLTLFIRANNQNTIDFRVCTFGSSLFVGTELASDKLLWNSSLVYGPKHSLKYFQILSARRNFFDEKYAKPVPMGSQYSTNTCRA